MDYYILLLFDDDDSVCAVRTVAARSPEAAEDMASVAQQAHQSSAGYQLWRGGARVAATYPMAPAIYARMQRGADL